MADNVCTVRVFSKLAKAAIEEESIPPERRTPTGTSLLNLILTESRKI